MPILKVISGGERVMGQRYVVNRDQVYIGRDPGNDIVLNDLGVTGYHARILKTAQGYLLIEERTSTGIWVQEQRVSHVLLEHGMRFRLGRTELVFDMELSDTVPAMPTPAPAPPPAAPVPRPAPVLEVLAPPAGPTEAPTMPGRPVRPVTIEPDTPAWARPDADPSQLALPAREQSAPGGTCPGCETTLLGLERFCAICGARTRYGGRRRVALLKLLALLLVLAAGAFGCYTLTDGQLDRDGLQRAAGRVFGDQPPSWLPL